MGPSVAKNGRNDPISSSMIVSGCLKPFLAILDFFDSYRTLATLCKLKETPNLALLAISFSKMIEIGQITGPFFGQKIDLNHPRSVRFSIFWAF